MVKGLKYFVMSLSVIILFSCASRENTVTSKKEFIKSTIDSYADEPDEEYGEIDVSRYGASDEYSAKKGKFKKSNPNTPAYQRPENQVKKIEKKKTVIKPVNVYTTESHNFTSDEIKDIFKNIEETEELDENKEYSSKSIKILIDNYKNILETSSACCNSNISENLHMSGFQDEEISDIMNYNSENLSLQNKCLLVSTDDIKDSFNSPISNIILDARKSCICNNKDFLKKNISNFYRLYNKDPKFYEKIWIYRYKDKDGSIIEDDVNETIVNLAITLESCP